LIKHYPLNVKLFYLSVFFLPLVDSVLELRVGAGWEIYIPLIFISFFITPQIFNYRISLVFILAVISVVTSGIVGLLLVDGNISENLRSQVHSPEAGIFVESIRFTASIMLFVLSVYFFKNEKIFKTALAIFIFSASLEALYGVYELFIKIYYSSDYLPLLSQRAVERTTNIRVWGTFYEPSQFGIYMLMSLLVLLIYLARYQCLAADFVIKYKYLFVFVLFAGVVISLSRAAFLVLLFAAVIYFILVRQNFYKKLYSILLLTLLSSSIIFIYFYYLGEETFLQGWFYKYFESSKLMHDSIGYLSYDYSLFFKYISGIGQGALLLYTESGTNYMARFIIESGWFALVVYTFIYGKNLYQLFRMDRSTVNVLFIVLLLSFFAITIKYNSSTHSWTWFLLAIIHSYVRNSISYRSVLVYSDRHYWQKSISLGA